MHIMMWYYENGVVVDAHYDNGVVVDAHYDVVL